MNNMMISFKNADKSEHHVLDGHFQRHLQSIHFPSYIQLPHCPLQKLKEPGTALIVQKSEEIF